MKASLEAVLKKERIMVIDGSMSTALEHLGADLGTDLWTAMTLARQPELVRQVHIDYFRAGADCGITCSYQATVPGLMRHGFSREAAEEVISNAVRIFLDARDAWWNGEGEAAGRAYPLCLAGIGPYGAYLANGAEYTGNYGVSDRFLYDFHRRRMELLWEAGADLLLIETQPSLREALVEAQIAEELGADYWISFSCRDRERTCGGELIRDCAAALSEGHPRLKMIGVNCSRPEHITGLIREIRRGCDLPVGVYPNSGEIYDPDTKKWASAVSGSDFGSWALDYMKAGAVAVGGCCTTAARHIRQTAEARAAFLALDGAPRIGFGRTGEEAPDGKNN